MTSWHLYCRGNLLFHAPDRHVSKAPFQPSKGVWSSCRLLAHRATCSARICASVSEVEQSNMLSLQHASGQSIAVFGVEHLERNVEVAEYILEHKPGAVVVETSVDPQHGAASGNTLSLDVMANNDVTNMFQRLGGILAYEPHPLLSEVWQQLRPSHGEQLVYIAAFAVRASLIYGDRPKAETYQRLAAIDSPTELDHAFAVQCWLNFEELLDGSQNRRLSEDESGSVDDIMLLEREAVLCNSLNSAANSGGRGVVGVVGAAHLPGIVDLWQESRWKQMYDRLYPPAASSSSDSDSQHSSSTGHYWEGLVDEETADSGFDSRRGRIDKIKHSVEARLAEEERAGVCRALLESTMRLKTTAGVLNDMMRTIPQVPAASYESYLWTHELYAHPRMFLATLTREQLARVCSGWQCDMWEVLQPIRDARPVNGGSALDIDLVMDLRGLNYEFD